MFWRPWSNLVRSFQVSLWRSHHLLYVVFFSILVQVINASTLNLFIQHSIKHASRLQQSFFFFFFGAENQTAFTATASMTRGPSGPAPRSSVLLKWRADMRSLFMRICSGQTETDSRAKSLKRIPTFKSVFFLTLAPSQKRSSVALKGTGEQKSDRFRSNEGHGLRDPPPQRGF